MIEEAVRPPVAYQATKRLKEFAMPKALDAVRKATDPMRRAVAGAIAPSTSRLPTGASDAGQVPTSPTNLQGPEQQGLSNTRLFHAGMQPLTSRPLSTTSPTPASLASLSMRGLTTKRPTIDSKPANLDRLHVSTREYSTGRDGSKVSSAEISFRDKGKEANLIVMVDSGFGGGLTTAQLDGNIRQFGHYLCLPIGDKKKNSNINFTATMIAMPFLMALKDTTGRSDGRIADGVVIACNSATVNKDPAIEVFTKLVHEIAANPDKYNLPQQMKTNAKNLSKLLGMEPDYLKNRVRGIIDATTDQLAEDAQKALGTRDTHFLRIDSTNSTAESRLYPKQMAEKVQAKLEEQGYKLSKAKSLGFDEAKLWPLRVGTSAYNVSHAILHFEHESREKPAKTLYIEGRGNPLWVPIIEGREVREKGAHAVSESQEASMQAAKKLGPDHAIAAKIFEGAPDQSANCCTHYDALTNDIKDHYTNMDDSGNWRGTILSQSDVVKTLHDRMGGTVPGAMGHSLAITKGLRSDKADRDEGGEFVKGIINQTRQATGSNSPSEVRMFNLPPKQQEGFENLNKFMAMSSTKPIGKDHGYEFKGSIDRNGNLFVEDVVADTQGVKKQLTSAPSRRAVALLPEVETRIDGLEKLGSTGETRGMDFVKWATDGRALTRATEHLSAVVQHNNTSDPSSKEAVAIMTGFVVVDPEGKPLGGENDGPPGAVMMAKKLVANGTPVVLVTDQHALPSLLSALKGSKLATLNDRGQATEPRERNLSHFDLLPNVKVIVQPRGGNQEDMVQKALKEKVNTLITIERPAPNREGKMANMRGQNISSYNEDLSGFAKEMKDSGAFTISIGDGGNELGMGSLSTVVSETRKPDNTEAVKGGAKIAVAPDFEPDALIVASVSNNGGLEVAVALDASLDAEKSKKTQFMKHQRTFSDYIAVVGSMAEEGMSMDGVNKDPAGQALSVDGRELGTLRAAQNSPAKIGSEGATHSHMFNKMIETVLPPE